MDFAGDVMTRAVVTVLTDSSILEVQRLMVSKDISRVVVVDKARKPVGIITRKDLVSKLSADQTDRPMDKIPAVEVMSTKLATANPTTPLHEVSRTMIERGISSIIVTQDGEGLEGIVTKTDLCFFYSSRLSGRHRVADFMTRKMVTCKPSNSVFQVANTMVEHNVTRVPVVAEDGHLEGIVSLTDLTEVGVVLKPKESVTAKRTLFMRGMIMPSRNVSLLSARDVMTANPLTVRDSDDLATAADYMVRHDVGGLPVLNEDGYLVGIVTRTDIARALAGSAKEQVKATAR